MTLPEAIRRVRGSNSREWLAVQIGCTYNTVIRWETGKSIPTDHRHVNALVDIGVSRDAIIEAHRARVAA